MIRDDYEDTSPLRLCREADASKTKSRAPAGASRASEAAITCVAEALSLELSFGAHRLLGDNPENV